MIFRNRNKSQCTDFDIRNILVCIISLIVAAAVSWFTTFFVLYDIDDHYPNGDISVQITATGEKYHLQSCGYLHSSSFKLTLEDAVTKGYTPCSRCGPPRYISIEDYNLAKEAQPLVLLIIGIPLLCIPIAFLSVLIVEKVYNFIGIFDNSPDYFPILLIILIYIASLIQGYRIIIIW